MPMIKTASFAQISSVRFNYQINNDLLLENCDLHVRPDGGGNGTVVIPSSSSNRKNVPRGTHKSVKLDLVSPECRNW